MNNQIFITNLVISTVIGVPEWERLIPQNLYLDLTISLINKDNFDQDDISKTVDYATIVDLIKHIAKNNKNTLLESFGEEITSQLIKQYPIQTVQLKIAKKKILPEADYVGVVLTRSI
jgi:dihydroneopterin aldolase